MKFPVGTKKWWVILILILSFADLYGSRSDSANQQNRTRLSWILASEAVVYSGGMIGLGTIWYDEFESFHLFNDNKGWGAMDKMGHFTSAQHLSRLNSSLLKWSGMSEKKAIWTSAAAGVLYLTSVEIFDGFSPEWGFSMGDFAANISGAGLFLGQELFWKEQRILTKWSYNNSRYAQYRPELLGSGGERWLKDYNGQTYWLSFNIKSFARESHLPAWLNLAVGYGIEGYTGADQNPTVNDAGNPIPSFTRYSQVYLSPDIDLSKIKTDSKLLRSVLTALNFIKIPLPALSYDQKDSLKFHWFSF